MIKNVPNNWIYNNSLDNLFLFYQLADELLSEKTSDTYSLPMHNSLTLISEISEIHSLLERYDLIKEYYKNYVPPIIEELLCCIEKDYLLKRLLGNRLSSLTTGFTEAKTNPALLNRWRKLFLQACSPKKYRDLYKEEIVSLVQKNTDKEKLIYCTKNYFVSLKFLGYSREFLYITTRLFFSNRSMLINNSQQIEEYFSLFSCHPEAQDFLILMDLESIDYLESLNAKLSISKRIEKINTPKKDLKEQLNDYEIQNLIREFESMKHQRNPHKNISIVRFESMALDPYSAIKQLNETLNYFQVFSRYFKHFYYSKQIYKVLIRNSDGNYKELKQSTKGHSRPYIEQSIINSRIKDFIYQKSLSDSAYQSMSDAIQLHAEAIDSRNTSSNLRTFWIALETLFSNPSPHDIRDNAINSVISIVQKTYLLKILRLLYANLKESIMESDLKALGIVDFNTFVLFFASFDETTSEFKQLCSHLNQNLLLRFRLHSLRKELKSGKKIGLYLSNHKQKIEWQLKRIYRIRNISTHLGMSVSGMHKATKHLHNYFDYMINYMFCKIENGDYIVSTSALVFEAKTDNQIYNEFLRKNESLSKENYMDLLFGPDQNLIDYMFEY